MPMRSGSSSPLKRGGDCKIQTGAAEQSRGPTTDLNGGANGPNEWPASIASSYSSASGKSMTANLRGGPNPCRNLLVTQEKAANFIQRVAGFPVSLLTVCVLWIFKSLCCVMPLRITMEN